MRVILLAAGGGRRLAPLTEKYPKVLIPLQPDDNPDDTLLARHLAAFREVGIDELIVVVGHKEEALRDALDRQATSINVQVYNNPRYERGSMSQH